MSLLERAALAAITPDIGQRLDHQRIRRRARNSSEMLLGQLDDLVMLDLRSYRDAPATTVAQLGDPARTLLGAKQKQWLQGELAKPTQWKLLGNSVQLMTVNYPPTGLLGNLVVGPVERNQDA